MPHVIVELPSASRRKQEEDPQALSREVWKHEALAKEQGLHPVVELYSHKSKACKRLSKLWAKGSELKEDTLDGIYLIRVNLLKHVPKAVVLLTPRVVLGVPLFVAWGPTGQVLSPIELGGFGDAELELPLSAFFEDVVAGKPFRLTHKRGVPLRDAASRGTETVPQGAAPRGARRRGATPSPTRSLKSASGESQSEPAKSQAASREPQAEPAKSQAEPAKSQAASREPKAKAAQGADAAAPEPTAAGDAVASASPPSADPNVLALAQQLEPYLEKAKVLAVSYLSERGLLCDATLESLVDLDSHIRDTVSDVEADTEAAPQLHKAAGALAVYFGETIRECADASWYVDASQSSLLQALRLRIATATETHDVAPSQIVLDVLSSPAENLFGRGVVLSGLLDQAEAGD